MADVFRLVISVLVLLNSPFLIDTVSLNYCKLSALTGLNLRNKTRYLVGSRFSTVEN